MRTVRRIALACALSLACASPPESGPAPVPEPPEEPGIETIAVEPLEPCPEARPEVCTRDYRPVCASVDRGVRCVKPPCPAAEWRTYPNACSACADPKVVGHLAGACPDPPAGP